MFIELPPSTRAWVDSLARSGVLLPWVRVQVQRQVLGQQPDLVVELETAQNELLQQQNLRSREELQQYLLRNGLDAEAFNDLALEQARWRRYCEQRWGATVAALYLERKSSFDRVQYSLIRHRDPDFARELFFRLQEGEDDFAELASRYSEGPEAGGYGVIGPIPLSSPSAEIRQVLDRLNEGEISQPFLIRDTWFIIRLDRLFSSSFNDQIRAQLIEYEAEQWLNQQSLTVIAQLTQLARQTGR